MIAYIYTITTDDGLYVGSTNNFKLRCIAHKSVLKNNPKFLLYQNILSNNGIYKIQIYCQVNCRDKRQLEFYEQQYIVIIGSNLNSQKAFQTEEEIKEEKKEYDKERNEKKKIKFVCDCGGKYTYSHKSTHYKSIRHRKYIKNN